MKKNIDYNNLFITLNEASAYKNVDFLEELGALCDLLIFLLNNSMRIINSAEDQNQTF